MSAEIRTSEHATVERAAATAPRVIWALATEALEDVVTAMLVFVNVTPSACVVEFQTSARIFTKPRSLPLNVPVVSVTTAASAMAP
jgi:hypothetical protein